MAAPSLEKLPCSSMIVYAARADIGQPAAMLDIDVMSIAQVEAELRG